VSEERAVLGQGILGREIRAVLRLAAPVVAVQLGMMLMGAVDVMMLGRVDASALAAGAVGNAIGFGLIMFPLGTLMALDPLVAQAFGARDHERIRLHFQRGLVLAAVMSIVVGLLMWDVEPVLVLFGQEEQIVTSASAYIRALIPGALAFLLFGVLRQTLQAMSIVWPALVAIAIANVVNVIANYALVFGHFGMPRLEVVGSAYATSISRWTMFLGLAVLGLRPLSPFMRQLERRALRFSSHLRFLALGAPVGLQISLEMWVFGTVAILMGGLGTLELAGHQIALTFAGLAFMVPLGIAGAAATRVGNAIGRRDQAGARRSAVVSLVVGAAFMSLSGVCFFWFPETLSSLFTSDSQVIAMASLLLPIAAAFQIVDGLQVVGAGVLRGTADTRFPALIAFVGYWIVGLPSGLWLAYRADLGPSGLWWGLTLGLASVALLFVVRIRARFASPIALLAVE